VGTDVLGFSAFLKFWMEYYLEYGGCRFLQECCFLRRNECAVSYVRELLSIDPIPGLTKLFEGAYPKVSKKSFHVSIGHLKSKIRACFLPKLLLITALLYLIHRTIIFIINPGVIIILNFK
jgi:hypothetical protein